jgi:arylformamidase
MPHVYRDFNQAALDAQYNNRALVPDFSDHVNRWARASESARDRLPCRLDVQYGRTPLERLDYFPSSRKRAPLHVFIHGGYWRAMDKNSFSHLALAFTDAGVGYAALNYPLAPQARMDVIVRSVRQALLWLTTHAEDLDIDPNRISMSGHSAGGQLVAMVAATDWSTFGGSVPVTGPVMTFGLSLSGIYDLEPIRLSYLNADLNLDRAESKRNSPIDMTPKRLPPLMFAVGAQESGEFRRQQRNLVETWLGQGHAIDAHELDAHNHFTIVEEIERADSSFLQSVMRRIVDS